MRTCRYTIGNRGKIERTILLFGRTLALETDVGLDTGGGKLSMIYKDNDT